METQTAYDIARHQRMREELNALFHELAQCRDFETREYILNRIDQLNITLQAEEDY